MLACQFGASVSAVGANAVSFSIRLVIRSVEHVVSRYLYHPSATFLNGLSQIVGCSSIQFHAQILILLSLVDSRIGSTVDDAVDGVLTDKLLDGFLVSNIQFSHIRIKIGMLGILFLQQLHLIS